MIDLLSIAKKKSNLSKHPAEEWHSILNAAVHDPACAQMTDGEIYQLVEAVIAPEQMSWLLDLFRDNFVTMTDEMPFDHLMNKVSASTYTLTDWINALQDLHSHLVKQGQNLGLREMTLKIQNTISNIGAVGPGRDLATLVRENVK